jgi:hypothetical protein
MEKQICSTDGGAAVEGCRFAEKHNISVTEFRVRYGWVRCFTVRH